MFVITSYSIHYTKLYEDTETLVETALKHAASMQVKKIADFGVGSGCILLSVLSELEDVCGIGVV